MAKRKVSKSTVVIKRVKVYRKNLSKDCVVGYAYSGSEPYIEIDPNQSDKQYFLTCVHELCHILLPDLSEKEIIRIEKTFGQTLYSEFKRRSKKRRDK
jgi:Zn-dependent peptidase ImmA (M78 family)